MSTDDTLVLLQRYHEGDEGALNDLMRRHLPTVTNIVRRRLGPRLRGRMESGDIVQESMCKALRFVPRFRVSHDGQFRALLARIVENVIRDEGDRYNALRRKMSREQPLDGTIIDLDPRDSATSPSAACGELEAEAMLRMALELLEPDARDVLVLREWGDKSWAEVGAELGISEDAARKRCKRAMVRLTSIMRLLQQGSLDLDQIAAADDEAEAGADV